MTPTRGLPILFAATTTSRIPRVIFLFNVPLEFPCLSMHTCHSSLAPTMQNSPSVEVRKRSPNIARCAYYPRQCLIIWPFSAGILVTIGSIFRAKNSSMHLTSRACKREERQGDAKSARKPAHRQKDPPPPGGGGGEVRGGNLPSFFHEPVLDRNKL